MGALQLTASMRQQTISADAESLSVFPNPQLNDFLSLTVAEYQNKVVAKVEGLV